MEVCTRDKKKHLASPSPNTLIATLAIQPNIELHPVCNLSGITVLRLSEGARQVGVSSVND